MRLGETVGQRNTDRAHRNVNAVSPESRKATLCEHDVLDRGIVTEHREEDFAAARIGDALGDLRALGGQRLGLAAGAIVEDDAMTGLQQIERHWGAHVAKTDKAYIHRTVLALIFDWPLSMADNPEARPHQLDPP